MAKSSNVLDGFGPDHVDPNDAADVLGKPGELFDVEKVIATNAAAHPAELLTVQTLARDEEATEDLDLKAVAKGAGVKEDLLHDASVRGKAKDGAQYVLYLYESEETGRTAKGFFPLKDLPKTSARAKKAAKPKTEANKKASPAKADPKAAAAQSGDSK